MFINIITTFQGESDMAVILGIGNTLLKDEGIGIHLLNYLKAENPHWESDYNIEMLDGGTLSFDLLANIQADQELLVLDAVNLKQAPGSVYCLQDQAMDKFLSQPGKSVHEVSLQDLLDMKQKQTAIQQGGEKHQVREIAFHQLPAIG